MHPPAYLVVLENPERYGIESTAIAASHIQEQTREVIEAVKRGVEFDDDEELIYYDELEDGYVAKSDIKAIIDIDELIGENVSELDDQFLLDPDALADRFDTE